MIYPTIQDLTKDKINRYELAIATAKCARIITDEYVEQRAYAEKLIERKETDKPISALIDKDIRDEKAVKNAITRIHRGEYQIVRTESTEETTEETTEAASDAE